MAHSTKAKTQRKRARIRAKRIRHTKNNRKAWKGT